MLATKINQHKKGLMGGFAITKQRKPKGEDDDDGKKKSGRGRKPTKNEDQMIDGDDE